MKTMKYLGCLLALVFAGASAFAGVWFEDSVGQDLPITRWYTTTKGTSVSSDEWVWTTGAQGELSYGSYNNWTTPLTYEAEQSQSLAAKDSTITTSVKFTAMDIEDLNEQTIGEDVKGGLTVVEDASTTPATLSYYGIVSTTAGKAWKPLTATDVEPTLDEFVDVTVELKNNLNNTYTITYKIGNTALEVATGSSFTMDTPESEELVKISKVEYLGNFSLKSLAGNVWANPCILTLTKPEHAYVYVNGATTPLEGTSVSVARGSDAWFGLAAMPGYLLSHSVISPLSKIDDSMAYDLTTGVTVTKIPDPTEVGGDVPTAITVDAMDIAARKAAGADEGPMGYLYTQQANGQLGWVNVTLGIGDSADAKIAAQPVEQLDEGAVVLDFNLDGNPKAYYSIGGTSNDVPAIALSNTKAGSNGIVTVDVVVKDEGGVDHVVATKDVGILEAGKDTTGAKEGTKTFDIVGVPWGSMDANAEKVSLDELLNKSLLTLGDMVYIKNGADYDVYELVADEEGNRFWEKKDAAKGRSSLAAATTAPVLNQGDALWIERSIDSRIVFSGAAVTQPVEQKASAPATEGGEAWSLIANTSLKPLALSTITPSGANDRIIVETIGAPIQYEYDSEKGWGYYESKLQENGRYKMEWTPGVSIPAGTGFWYVNTGDPEKPDADVTITIPANVD